MAPTAMIHVRLDEKMKVQATEELAAMGLSVSDAMQVFLSCFVTEQQLPFAFKVPNTETRFAMAEADEIMRMRRDRFAAATRTH